MLVVDDSTLFRHMLSNGLSTDSGIEVVATAVDPFDARDKILEYRPDVMTCDVQMPRMNGIEFIKRLIPQYPMPVIVISSISAAVFDALNAGAVDFVAKPDSRLQASNEQFIENLIAKIKIAAVARVTPSVIPVKDVHQVSAAGNLGYTKVIAIGASTGGTEAIVSVVRNLPVDVPGVVIVQHIPPVFSKLFSQRLEQMTNLSVKEAETGDIIEPGHVLIAPGNQHMQIKRIGNRFKVVCTHSDKVSGHRPSVDVLFRSVAQEAGDAAVGVILTGMGADGALGLKAMREAGARTIGQDESSSVVYGMPKAAYHLGAVEKQASLNNIPALICSMLR